MRILTLSLRKQADQPEQVIHTLIDFFFGLIFIMQLQHFRDLVTDCQDRVQARHWILEDHGKVGAAELLQFLGIHGQNVLSMNSKELQKFRGADLAMIFQDPMTSLNPVFTVGQQIADAIMLHNPTTKEQAFKKAEEMLELVGIPAVRAVEYPHQFSGGMKQRVVIAIALACNPSVLIADEPTTALDVTIQAQVIAMMKKLRDDRGMSMIMITHDLGIIADVCDEVAIMYAGRIIEYGTLRDVFNHTRHPYTEGLFNSLPNIRNRSERLKPIPGLMPDPSNLPKGCAFAPRCRYCTAACLEKRPEDRMVSDTHMVACTAYDNPDFRIDRPEKN